MTPVDSKPKVDSDRTSRRELLRIGALSILASASGSWRAASAANLAESDQHHAANRNPEKHCIFMHLQGGPSHIDLWDPKPSASPEVRGPFRTIDTKVPGVYFGELMEKSAQVADKLLVVRSMTHKFTNHIAGTYITLTGSSNQPDADREAHSDDFPGPAAILNYLDRSRSSVPRGVSLPNLLSIPGPSNRMPGQFGGFLGSVYDPILIDGNPNDPKYNPLSLSLTEGMSLDRMENRLSLLTTLDRQARTLERELNAKYDQLRASAYELVCDGRVREALDLSQEPAQNRDRYGRNKLGQSLLLARRLIEAGVQLVGCYEFNQKWDTHGGLAGRYREIVPEMDRGFAALVADLDERGLLQKTLVINTGEFGRTPTVNKDAGRDHWPNVYSTVLAGGGVRGGETWGASDNKGSEVLEMPVAPADVLATMWHTLGIDPETIVYDRLNRPIQISDGRVIRGWFS